jgi:Asp-tRNA(Asn)/Glu-tRNA(Gln) amidotransferase A subunit family amidase
MPAVSVPVGYSVIEGLPIGLQIMGWHWEEKILLKVAEVLESKYVRKKPHRNNYFNMIK